MKKKIVLSGSVSLQDEFGSLIQKLNGKYEILTYPVKDFENDDFLTAYPKIFRDFYENICKSDILLICNFDKNGVKGYVGSSAFAELCFALAQNLVYGKQIEIYILQLPDKTLPCYDEIMLWLEIGKIKIWNNG